MSLTFMTNNPTGLLSAFKKGIQDGNIRTWTVDAEGDFTHSTSSEQWKYRGWLRPIIKTDRLEFAVIENNSERMPQEVFAIYQGRFIEAMIAHFPRLFTTATATALPTATDHVNRAA